MNSTDDRIFLVSSLDSLNEAKSHSKEKTSGSQTEKQYSLKVLNEEDSKDAEVVGE